MAHDPCGIRVAQQIGQHLDGRLLCGQQVAQPCLRRGRCREVGGEVDEPIGTGGTAFDLAERGGLAEHIGAAADLATDKAALRQQIVGPTDRAHRHRQAVCQIPLRR